MLITYGAMPLHTIFICYLQKKHDRGTVYNLPGDETDQLTHYGQSLGDMESFEDIRITSDEEDVEGVCGCVGVCRCGCGCRCGCVCRCGCDGC